MRILGRVAGEQIHTAATSRRNDVARNKVISGVAAHLHRGAARGSRIPGCQFLKEVRSAMKTILWRVAALVVVCPLAAVNSSTAQSQTAATALRLPVAGTFEKGGEFTGTISINRFEQRDDRVVAVGFVSGVLSKGGHALGTAVAGEVTWPVAIKSGGQVLAIWHGANGPRQTQVAWSPGVGPSVRVLPAQTSCQVLDLALGPVNVNVLGVQVALSAVTFSLTGGTGPLGDLVCAASNLLGNVAGIVNLLNSILGLLTGLVGGLTGGLGGAIPTP
jgi:hypothetical protein